MVEEGLALPLDGNHRVKKEAVVVQKSCTNSPHFKLAVTSATLVVTGALVVTKS